VAIAQTVLTDEDCAVSIVLSASDVDGDALGFMASAPSHGTLSGTAPNLVYTPTANYNGPDSFTFIANDGKLNSSAATVSISIRPANDAPVVQDQSLQIARATPTAITLYATDVDGDALTFTVTAPSHGTLSGTAPNLVYTPTGNYHGPDSFSFKALDGNVSSDWATVSLTVLTGNHTPVPVLAIAPLYTLPTTSNTIAVLARNGKDAVVNLDASHSSDADGDPLNYYWLERSTTPFATGVKVSRTLSVGSHNLSLVVSDGLEQAMCSCRIEVVSPCQILEELVAVLDEAKMPKTPHNLYDALEAAQDAFEAGKIPTGLNRLSTLQRKIDAQMKRHDPATAAMLNQLIQNLINTINGK
jgi:hypothetical protein